MIYIYDIYICIYIYIYIYIYLYIYIYIMLFSMACACRRAQQLLFFLIINSKACMTKCPAVSAPRGNTVRFSSDAGIFFF